MRKLVLALSVPLFLLAANAQAHFNLVNPPSTAKSTEGGKGVPPCGPDLPAATPMPVTGGSKLMIDVNETTPHPGFYRIALALQSRSELPVDNVVRDAMGKVLSPTNGGMSVTADFQDPAKFPVLADHLWPHGDGPAQSFHTELVLPNVTCDKCTLQVIEFMANHGPNQGGGYFYHHCADLKITANPALPPFNPSGAGGAGGGSSGGAAGAGGAATAGASGASTGGTGGAAGAAGAAGASGGAQAVAGASGTAGASSAGASAAGTPNASNGGDTGGCSFTGRAAGSAPWLSVLLGLLALGRRRRLRRAA